MSQADVLKILRRARKPLDAGEIAERVGSTGRGTISRNLKQLFKFKEVIKIQDKPNMWSNGGSIPKWVIGLAQKVQETHK